MMSRQQAAFVDDAIAIRTADADMAQWEAGISVLDLTLPLIPDSP